MKKFSEFIVERVGKGLFKAVSYHDYKKMAEIIEKDPDSVNATGRDGTTPLFFAVSTVDEKAVEMLIDAGANVNVRESSGRTPLMVAVLRANIDYHIHRNIKVLSNIIKMLMKAGAKTNISDADGKKATDYNVFRYVTEI